MNSNTIYTAVKVLSSIYISPLCFRHMYSLLSFTSHESFTCTLYTTCPKMYSRYYSSNLLILFSYFGNWHHHSSSYLSQQPNSKQGIHLLFQFLMCRPLLENSKHCLNSAEIPLTIISTKVSVRSCILCPHA